MSFSRLPLRDPRTVARDIPGVLDILFPKLNGGLVGSLNRKMFPFENIIPVSNEQVDESKIEKAMLFELAMVRAEYILASGREPDWQECLSLAADRQRKHYDSVVPENLEQPDLNVATHASDNLIVMLTSIQSQNPGHKLMQGPSIPGLGWIASGKGDFSLGSTLIEVKHTDRNFISGDFKQVLMYWLLKYAKAIESDGNVWSDFLLLNPRRNRGLFVKFDDLLKSASSNLNRVELFELLRSIVGQDWEHG